MSLLAAASCPLVEHYQLTSKPGATRFRAAVQLTRWEPNLELRLSWPCANILEPEPASIGISVAAAEPATLLSLAADAPDTLVVTLTSAYSPPGKPAFAFRATSENCADDGYPYDDYDDEMEEADDGGAFRPPRLPPALVVDHTRARDGGREKAGLVYV